MNYLISYIQLERGVPRYLDCRIMGKDDSFEALNCFYKVKKEESKLVFVRAIIQEPYIEEIKKQLNLD